MRRSTFTSSIPALILLIGFALTAVFFESENTGRQAASAEIEAGNNEFVRAVMTDAERRLVSLSERLDAAALSIAAADADSLDAQVEATGLLDSDSIVDTICFPVGGGQFDCQTFNGRREAGAVPLRGLGLQVIERGDFAERLAFAGASPNSESVGVVLLIDRGLLDVELQRDIAMTVAVEGLPGGAIVTTPPVTAIERPGGAVLDRATGRLSTSRELTFLRHPVQLVVAAEPGQLLPETVSSTIWILIVGASLTLCTAGLGVVGGRALGQVMAERDLADVAREEAAQRFRTSFANAPIGVVEVSSDGRIVAVNPRFASQLGFTVEELDGLELLELVDGEDRNAARGRLQSLLDGEQIADQSERRYRSRNGAAVWVRESASVLDLGNGNVHVLIQAEDVSDERRARAELHRKALFDDLTGLPNRANLTARLNRAIESERTSDAVLAVMFVDLDKFKEVNDTLGHEAGDQLLIEVAERLRRARSTDTVARLGGDEFVVICEGLATEEDADACAARFADALNSPMRIGEVEVPVQASIGLVITPGDVTPDTVLRQADQAMYQAKTTGRNRLVKFDLHREEAVAPEPAKQISQAELVAAIEGDQFLVHYHPVFDAADTDRVVGVEALVRWEHPDRGILVPSEFLLAAEKAELLAAIDRLVVRQGLDALQEWVDTDPSAHDWFVSFNLGSATFLDRSFPAFVSERVEATGVAARQVVLERDEGGFMRQPPVAVLVTRELRDLGVRVAIDHFGAGGVSMSEVPALEFDLLKIDRSFVRSPSARQRSVLSALHQMADALDLVAMVEGVETAEELSAVRGAHIEMVQGFHLCRPMDADGVRMQYLRPTAPLPDGGGLDRDHALQ